MPIISKSRPKTVNKQQGKKQYASVQILVFWQKLLSSVVRHVAFHQSHKGDNLNTFLTSKKLPDLKKSKKKRRGQKRHTGILDLV